MHGVVKIRFLKFLEDRNVQYANLSAVKLIMYNTTQKLTLLASLARRFGMLLRIYFSCAVQCLLIIDIPDYILNLSYKFVFM